MNYNVLNKIGAAILLIMAGVLALTGAPPNYAPLQAAEEVGQIAYSNEDKISPVTLGEWIIEEKGDFQVVDIRSPFEFADFNIPGSMNLPFVSLMTKSGLAMLPKYKKIVLAASDEARSGQAWMVLRGKGYNAFILDGGAQGWWNQVMTPATIQNPPDSNIDPAEYAAKLRAMRETFGGGGSSLSSQPAPTMDAPPPPAIPSGGTKKKKKSGGC